MITVENIVKLVKEIESSDPLDWAHMDIAKTEAQYLIAEGMLEQWLMCESDEQHLMLLAVATHLSVENFLLHTQNLELKENIMRM